MRTYLVAMGLLLAVSAGDKASAIDYPWCANLSGDIGATNCSFTTLEQCRATVSGIGGFCVQNPSYRTPLPAVSSRRRAPR